MAGKPETNKTKAAGNGNLILLTLWVIVIALALTPPVHGAEKYPVKPVKIVVTHAAGTSNDVETRTVAPFLQRYLGAPVVIENMPGTGGRKSREFVMKEKPDGYTLLSTGMPSTQFGEILFNGRYRTLDFTHIFSLFNDAIGVIVKSDSPYKGMADFVEKHKGKTLSCGIPGLGSGSHMDAMNFATYLGLTPRWVPYDGGTEAVTAMVGGHIDYVVGNIGSATAMLSAKIVRPILIFDEKRDPRFPDVPTHKDLGFKISAIANIRGVVGPPGVPPEVVKKLEEAFQKAAHDKEFLSVAAKASLIVDPIDSNRFFAVSTNIWNEIRGQAEKLKTMVKPQ
ncbi:MAG: tripartite tricarboxylate transporter substrate binding protein [Thermodesulfobacteriota bacterium]